jgi:glycyl-tRNA synthetase beta chain
LHPSLLHEAAEKQLNERYEEVKADVVEWRKFGDLPAALAAIASLRPDVDRFFDETMVMVEDKAIRDNRLALLARLFSEFSTIADFSEIVVRQASNA